MTNRLRKRIAFKFLGSQVATNGECGRDVVHRMNGG